MREHRSSCEETVPLFEAPILGGFECSCHRLADGRRLDLSAATRHLELAEADYARLRAAGITACRDGVSWVHADRGGGAHDLARAARLVRAAERSRVDVVWDLMHFGWPDDVDPFAPSFPSRFARWARAFARFLADATDRPPMIVPVNEMSFLAWAGGDVACMNPFERARGVELKAQLVRATIEAIEAIREVHPRARFLQPEPVIHVVAPPEHPRMAARVACDELLQFQAWDMLVGRVWPSLGGHPKYLDVVGVNYYPDNQFMPDGTTIRLGDIRYKPLARMLLEVWARYRRPMIISETGAEGAERAPWFRYVARQSLAAIEGGCELHGVTLYPIVNHAGWNDDRHCENGLWDYTREDGTRAVDGALLDEIRSQMPRLERARAAVLAREREAVRAPPWGAVAM
jgi:hypothetical protein